jgi:hypothetical protein
MMLQFSTPAIILALIIILYAILLTIRVKTYYNQSSIVLVFLSLTIIIGTLLINAFIELYRFLL